MFNFDLQLFAHKKGVSSTRNGRDSESKRLALKNMLVLSLLQVAF